MEEGVQAVVEGHQAGGKLHKAKQIHLKDLGDGAISVLMRCCGDSSTDQWHTLYVKAETTEQEIQDFLAYAQSCCEKQHGARERARAIIEQGIKP